MSEIVASPEVDAGDRPSARRPVGQQIPRSLEHALIGISIAVAAFLAAAVPIAMLGAFRTAVVVPAAAATTVVMWILWFGGERSSVRAPFMSGVAAIAVVVVSLGIGSLNARFAAQHVLVDADPGVYTVNAEMLSKTGKLTVDGIPAVFGHAADLRYDGSGYSFHGGDRMYPQFVHGLATMMAASRWALGEAAMLKVTAILSAIGVLLVFMMASRLIPLGWAAVVASALALNSVQMFFSRDAYSELPTQLLLFAGLAMIWDLIDRGVTRKRRWFVAGGMLGATCLLRADSFYYLPLFVAALIMVVAMGRKRTDRSVLAKAAAAAAAGILIPTVIAAYDGFRFSPSYFTYLTPRLKMVGALFIAVAVIGILFLLARPREGPLLRNRALAMLPLVASILIVGFAAYGFFIRPHVEKAIWPEGSWPSLGAIQRAEGVPVEVTRSYDEQTFRWLGWYLGPVVVLGGMVGFAARIRRAFKDEEARAMPFLMLFGATMLLYTWRLNANPVHYWSMRRFLPIAIPGLLIGFGILVAWVLRRVGGRTTGRIAISCAAIVALLAPPLAMLPGRVFAQTQAPLLSATKTLCRSLPEPAAALLVGRSPITNGLPQTIEAYCGVPAASTTPDITPERLRELAAIVARGNRNLVAISADPLSALTSRLVVETDFEYVLHTLTRLPERKFRYHLRLYVTPLEP